MGWGSNAREEGRGKKVPGLGRSGLCFLIMSGHRVLLGFLFVLMLAVPGLAQKPSSFDTEDDGYIFVLRDHVRWVSPEAVISDLQIGRASCRERV